MSTVTLISNKDVFIDKESPTANYDGSNPSCYIGFYDPIVQTKLRRSIVTFDGSTLAGKGIESAILSIYVDDMVGNVSGRTYLVNKLTRNDWVEVQATYNIYKTGSNWTLVGGDFVIISPVNASASGPSSVGWLTFDITPIVQDAADNSLNINLLIKDSTEVYEYVYIRICSRHYTSDTTLRPKLDVTYGTLASKSFTSDTISSVTESLSVTKSSFDISVANNLTAYIMNKNKGWSKITNAPYTSMIYRPSLQELWATRRNVGQICKVDSGTTFDGSPINSTLQTGYFDFGQFDEVQVMEGKMAEAIKRIRASHNEIKSAGNLILTIYTENDISGQSFTITPDVKDNITYNMVRTTLSRDIKGKFISFKISNQNGEDFFCGKMSLRIIPKGLR